MEPAILRTVSPTVHTAAELHQTIGIGIGTTQWGADMQPPILVVV